MMIGKRFIRSLILIFCASFSDTIFAYEFVQPIRFPENKVILSGSGELRDDVYSSDIRMVGEWAPIAAFSFFSDLSWRLFSYEMQLKSNGEILHSKTDLQMNGLNASVFGVKIKPFRFWGMTLTYKTPAGDGDKSEKHSRYGLEFFYLRPLWKSIFWIGWAGESFWFAERKNYKPGAELGSKFLLKILIQNWELENVFSFRRRIINSENKTLEKPYQNMHDSYAWFRYRTEGFRNFQISEKLNLGIGLAYEFSYGMLYANETGHRIEILMRCLWF